jgi:hypothetical protein
MQFPSIRTHVYSQQKYIDNLREGMEKKWKLKYPLSLSKGLIFVKKFEK